MNTLGYAAAGLAGALLLGAVIVLIMSKKEPKEQVSSAIAFRPPPPASAVSAPAKPPPAAPKPAPEPAPASADEADALTSAPTCEKLLGNMPPSPGVYPGAAYDEVRAARKELARGDMDGAQGAYCKAIRFDPQNPDAIAGLARVLMLRRDAKSAAQWAKDAVKGSPDEAAYQILLGDTLAMGGDMVKALDPFLLGYGISQGDAAAREKVVLAQLKLGAESARKQDHLAAERAFRRALTLDPTRGLAATGIARALLDEGQATAAAHWAKKATQLDPKSAAAYVTLGDALAKTGQQAAASAAWKKAAEVDPADPAARARAMTE